MVENTNEQEIQKTCHGHRALRRRVRKAILEDWTGMGDTEAAYQCDAYCGTL